MVRKTRCLVQIGSSTSDYEHSTNCLFNLYVFDHQIYRGREERNVMILPANGNHGSDFGIFIRLRQKECSTLNSRNAISQRSKLLNHRKARSLCYRFRRSLQNNSRNSSITIRMPWRMAAQVTTTRTDLLGIALPRTNAR